MFLQLFWVLPNFHDCLDYNSKETLWTCFLFPLEKTATKYIYFPWLHIIQSFNELPFSFSKGLLWTSTLTYMSTRKKKITLLPHIREGHVVHMQRLNTAAFIKTSYFYKHLSHYSCVLFHIFHCFWSLTEQFYEFLTFSLQIDLRGISNGPAQYVYKHVKHASCQLWQLCTM